MATTAEPTAQQIPTLIHLAALTHLEGQIRAAKTVQELQFLSVNETRRLIPYDHAFLLTPSGSDKESCQVLNASSVAVVDRHAPMIVWLGQAVQALFHTEGGKQQSIVEQQGAWDVQTKTTQRTTAETPIEFYARSQSTRDWSAKTVTTCPRTPSHVRCGCCSYGIGSQSRTHRARTG